jgi:hypothetical protein
MAKSESEYVYFPHYVNSRNDRKVRRLRKELGVEGYGIFFMILEVLREQSELKYPMDDIDLLAEEFTTSEQKVRVVICNYGLFQVDDGNFFYSPKQIEYLQPYFEKSKRMKHLALIRWSKSANGEDLSHMRTHSVGTTQALLTQSVGTPYAMQGKERKEKERIEEERKKEGGSQSTPPPRSKFIKPTLQEVVDYFVSKDQTVQQAQYYYDYRESVDWSLKGGQKLKNWKSDVNVWVSRNKASISKSQSDYFNPPPSKAI